MPRELAFIIGCTASGKSRIGYELASRVNGEILSADALKVYRRMNIGTAKPDDKKLTSVRHHLIDCVEPSAEFNVAKFVILAEEAIRDATSRGCPIIAVGGTALYIKGLCHGLFEGPGEDPVFRAQLRERAQRDGYDKLHQELNQQDPEAAARIHRNDYQRLERALEVIHLTGQPISQLQTQWQESQPRYDARFLGLRWTKEAQSRRINARVKQMLDQGLLDEVRSLLAEEQPLSTQARQAVGYAELIDHLQGKIGLDDAIEKIKINTRRLAKHQRTWFRRFSNVHWIELHEQDNIEEVVDQALRWYDPDHG